MRKYKPSAIRFFFSQAGFSYDPKTETALQGKWRNARALAQAEKYARELRLVFVWEYDSDPDVSWMDTEQRTEYENGHTEILVCSVFQDQTDCIGCDSTDDYRRRHEQRPDILACLGGIHVLTGDRKYKRVVEAELACEAIVQIQEQGAQVNV